MSGGDEEAPVENRFRSALGDDLYEIRNQSSACDNAFFRVKRAMENEAWVSTKADTFFAELTDHISAAKGVGDECKSAAENKYEREPQKVPPDDWRASYYGWSSYGSYVPM